MFKTVKNNSLSDRIAVVVVVLMAIGVVFVFSAGVNISKQLSLQQFYNSVSLRQLLFFPLAVLVMYAVSCVDYQKLSLNKGLPKSPVSFLLLLSITLLILVSIPSIGVERNYARRWLQIPVGPIAISFQPSELAKWAMPEANSPTDASFPVSTICSFIISFS